MTYAKPEIVRLGSATEVIEATGMKPYHNLVDGGLGKNPAYDLDE